MATHKAMRFTFAAICAATPLFTAYGGDLRVMIGTKAGNSGQVALKSAIAWAAEDGGIAISPWESGSNTCTYVIRSSDKINGGTFPDLPVALDNTNLVDTSASTITFPNMTVAKGALGFRCNGDGTLTLKGKFTVTSGVEFVLAANAVGRDGYPNANSVHRRDVTMSGELKGNSSGKVTYGSGLTSTWNNMIGSAEAQRNTDVFSTLTISGKASSFPGIYTMSSAPLRSINDPVGNTNVTFYGRNILYLNSTTAFGASGTSKPGAVTLRERTYLKVGSSVTQYASRGVSVYQGMKGGVYADDGDWTLTAPVTCGDGAIFEKFGPDAVTLAGDCMGVSTMEVTQGTLVLGADGSFADNLAVTVKPGATLVQNKFIGNINVTCEEGGTYTKDIYYIVPYVNAAGGSGTSTPRDFTSDMPELPLSVRLSVPIEIESFSPGFAEKRIEVARLPSDTMATAADFADVTDKTYGLPNTRFVIEDGEGYKSLVLVAKPVVWSLRDISSSEGKTGTINGEAGDWSYGDAAQAGFDYLLTNSLSRTGGNNITSVPGFLGDSLTTAVKDTVVLQLTNPDIDVGNLVCHAAQTAIRYVNGTVKGNGYTGITGGTIRVEDGALLNVQSRLASNNAMMTNVVAVAISGPGNLRASLYALTQGGGPVYLTGDNSGLSGLVDVTSGSENATEADAITLHLGQAASLGGAMPKFTANGVALRFYSFLYPEETMTLNAANRGITVSKGGFDVSEGRTLTVAVPLTIAGTAIKRGAGCLALGGALTYTSGSLAVKEGAVKALSDAAVANVPVTFSDGTAIVLDPEATTVNGFFGGTFAVSGEGTPKVRILLDTDGASFDAKRPYVLPICTMPATAADLTDKFTLVNPRGFVSRLVREDVTVNGVACVRYSVRYRPRNLVMSFR